MTPGRENAVIQAVSSNGVARCAVIGNPIAHSRSPEIHHAFARARGILLEYTRILAEANTFPCIVKDFFAKGGTGLNITLPFKESAFALASRHTPYAQSAGAANTLWMAAGELYADNTDGRGLLLALQNDHGFSLHNKRILILGAGGAARGIILPLCEAQAAAIHIANRSPYKAENIVSAHQKLTTVPLAAHALAELDTLPACDLIINATSASLSGEALVLPPNLVHRKTLAYDMVYGKNTPFLIWARSLGLSAHDGYSMLVNQAWLSFCQWFHLPPDKRP